MSHRQTTLRPSQGGKFHAPVVPSKDVRKNVQLAENDLAVTMSYQKFLEQIRLNPWQNEFIQAEFHGPKSKEVIKNGKKFIVYSA